MRDLRWLFIEWALGFLVDIAPHGSDGVDLCKTVIDFLERQNIRIKVEHDRLKIRRNYR